MTQALYRKWRPQVWEDVVGQNHVVQTLRNAVRSGRIAHAYLFAGPRGTGKTTVARILAKAVDCEAELSARPCNACPTCVGISEGRFMDLIEIDAASNTSVEDVRDLRDRVPFAPTEGRYKVYIIDEVHMLSTAAFNALLKTLEEPPAHALFVLATTEIHKVPLTVLSRCQRHEFRRLTVAEMVPYLSHLVEEEGLQAEPQALEIIARQATGSLRDAVSLLDQMASVAQSITLQSVLSVLGAAGSVAMQDFLSCLAARDASRGLALIGEAVDGGIDPRQFARQVTDQLRGVLLARTGNADLIEATKETRAALERFAADMDVPFLLRAIRAFGQASGEARVGWRPQLALELALVEVTQSVAETAGSGTRAAEKGTPRSSAAGPSSAPAPSGRRPTESASAATTDPPAGTVSGTESTHGSGEDRLDPQMALSIRRVNETWDRILALLRQRDTRAHTLYAQSRPYALEGEVLCLSFEADLPREKASRPETVARLQGILAEVLGSPLRIRCVLARADPARMALRVVEGGMVDVATRELGAQAIDLP